MIAEEFLNLQDGELLDQCEVHCYRASGPGGQKKNKTSSAVRLHHLPSGLIAKGEEDRSQHINKSKALKRLRMKMATLLLRSLPLEDYRPSRITQSCIAAGKLAVRLKDERTLLVINELLSLLDSSGGAVSKVAETIGVSTANLVKFFQIDPEVWRKVDHIRQANGLNSLKGDR